jgi:hypothetical protein
MARSGHNLQHRCSHRLPHFDQAGLTGSADACSNFSTHIPTPTIHTATPTIHPPTPITHRHATFLPSGLKIDLQLHAAILLLILPPLLNEYYYSNFHPFYSHCYTYYSLARYFLLKLANNGSAAACSDVCENTSTPTTHTATPTTHPATSTTHWLATFDQAD